MERRKEEKREERDAENRKIKGRRKERGTGGRQNMPRAPRALRPAPTSCKR